MFLFGKDNFIMKDILEDYKYSHLAEWNLKQKNIWLNLVDSNMVCLNDTDMFLLFSKWFNKFYINYNRYPSSSEAENLFIKEYCETQKGSSL